MAKRVRGSSTRPGQRRRLQRSNASRPTGATPASVPPSSTPSTSLTAAEEARAAELEAQIVAEEKASEATTGRSRERGARPADAPVRARSGSIAMRASEEYAYVARDVRRLTVIGGSLIAFLIILWVVTQATGAGPF